MYFTNIIIVYLEREKRATLTYVQHVEKINQEVFLALLTQLAPASYQPRTEGERTIS